MKNPVYASVSATLLLCVLACTAVTAHTGNRIKARTASSSSQKIAATTALLHDVEVVWVNVPQGIQNKIWNTQQTIQVMIRNKGTQAQTNVPVSVAISGVNTQSDSYAIPSLAAGAQKLVSFTLPVLSPGTQTITATVPVDEDESNNSKSITQLIDCGKLRYSVNENIDLAVGTGNNPGIVAVKYPAPVVPIQVNGVTVRISATAVAGKTITGVLVDPGGNIITQSDAVVISAAMQGKDIELPLLAPATFLPGDAFLAGVLQNEGLHTPIASNNTPMADATLTYTCEVNGSNAQQVTDRGLPAIGLLMTMRSDFSSTAAPQMMAGTPVMFFASSDFDSYTFKINNTAKQTSAETFFTYYPSNGEIATLEVMKNGCTAAVPDELPMEVKSIAASATNVLYVKKDHPSPGDGSSWANALNELADALRWAKSRESQWTTANPLKIYVAAGEYKPLYNAPDEYFGMDGGPNNAFRMVKNVQVYGGFTGTESSPANRTLGTAASHTILTGDYSNDDMIFGSAGTLTIINNIENALHVVIFTGDAGNALLDGFTISGGGGTMHTGDYEIMGGNPVWVKNGGGIYITGSSPTLSNLVITGNRASISGAGIYMDGSASTFTNLLFTRNYSAAAGGAIFSAMDGSPVLTNVTITNNRAAGVGGAISIVEASYKIRNSIIYGNSSAIASSNGSTDIRYSYVQSMPADIPNNNPDGNTDPQFTDAANGDYTLSKNSPLVNRGNNLYFEAGQTPDLTGILTDITSNPRIRDGVIDLGVYEAKPSFTLTQQPVSLNVCKGETSVFEVIATANSQLSYQWQKSTDGTTWQNIEGARQSVYITKAESLLYLHCVVSTTSNSITSAAATLSVKELEQPVINMPELICLEKTEVTLTALPAGGVFTGTGVTEDTWNTKQLLPGTQVINYSYTGANGCVATTSKTFKLDYCGQPGLVKFFQIGPNPTDGIVKVKLLLGEDLSPFSSYHITDIHGKTLEKKHYTFLKGWTELSFDLSKYRTGVYFFSIYNARKQPLITKKIIRK